MAFYVPLGPRGILLRFGTFADRHPGRFWSTGWRAAAVASATHGPVPITQSRSGLIRAQLELSRSRRGWIRPLVPIELHWS